MRTVLSMPPSGRNYSRLFHDHLPAKYKGYHMLRKMCTAGSHSCGYFSFFTY